MLVADKKSLLKKSVPLVVLAFLFVFILYLSFQPVFIGAQQNFNLKAFSPTSVNRTQSTLFNFTINANGTSNNVNITQVTITLPLGANFVSDSNGTNLSQAAVPNLFIFQSGPTPSLIWRNINNITVRGLIANGTNASFWFNASLPFAGDQLFTITTTDTNGVQNTTTQNVQANFTFAGYVKNESGLLQPDVNVSMYQYIAGTNGPPTERYEQSAITDADGMFSFGSINGSASQYKLKMTYTSGGNVSKIGTSLPPFPANMFYSKGTDDKMNLNGTTFYLQLAATLRLNATNSSGDSIMFGYEVIDNKVGFPIESNVMGQINTADVYVPSSGNYTVMFVRDFSQFPITGTFCNGTVLPNNLTCPTPPKSSSVTSLSAGEIRQVTKDLSTTNVRLWGCVNISNIAGVGWNTTVNVTNIILRVIPWTTSKGKFVPLSVKGDLNDLDLAVNSSNLNNSNLAIYGNHTVRYCGNDTGGNYFAFYNLSAMSGTDYILEVYAKNTSAGGDTKNAGGNTTTYAIFQNVSIAALDKGLNVTLQKLVGGYQTTNVTGTKNANASYIKINIINDTDGAVTTNMHIEVKVKNPIFGTINYMIESLTNGTFYIPILNNSNWAKVYIFPNDAPPMEKTLDLNNATNNVKLISVSFSGNGDKGLRRMNASGQLVKVDSTSTPFHLTFYSRGTNTIITEMGASDFNPMKALVAGSIDMEIKVNATGVKMRFNNFDMFSAKQPPMFAVLDNASMASSSQQWKFGNFVPRDVYDNVTLTIPYSASLNESWTYNLTLPVLYSEDPSIPQQFITAWNATAGGTVSTLGDDFIEYSAAFYKGFVNGSGITCSTTNSASACFMNTTSNVFILTIPHFSGIAPNNAGTAPSTPSTSVSGSGGGPSTAASYTWASILAGETKTLTLEPSEDVFSSITVTAKNNLGNVTIGVLKLSEKPSSVPSAPIYGNIYSYVQVTKTNANDANLSAVVIKFDVNTSWLNKNNYSKSSVTLWRYTTQWDELVTTLVNDGTSVITYKANSPGFSYFAVTASTAERYEEQLLEQAKKGICGNGVCEAENNETKELCCVDCGCPEGKECLNGSCQSTEETKKKWILWVGIALGVILAIVIAIIVISLIEHKPVFILLKRNRE